LRLRSDCNGVWANPNTVLWRVGVGFERRFGRMEDFMSNILISKSAKRAIANRGSSGKSGAISTARLIAGANRWRENYNPLRGLTLNRAIALMEAFPRGEYADLMWTMGAPLLGVECARRGSLCFNRTAHEQAAQPGLEHQDSARGRHDL